jgi:hypothetical protein
MRDLTDVACPETESGGDKVKMDTPNTDPPLDQQIVHAIVASAKRFEQAVQSGQNLIAAMAAQRIASSLRRFFPNSLQKSISSPDDRDANAQFPIPFHVPISVPFSAPDPAYARRVHEAVINFSEALMSGDIARALVALEPTGILRGILPPIDELHQMEIETARQAGGLRLPSLTQMAKLALWMGKVDKAEHYASEALNLTKLTVPLNVTAEATHDANMVMGLAAFQRGDVERAKEFLLASSRQTGSLEMGIVGPNLTLANELLKSGESEVVVQYLEQMRLLWTKGTGLLVKWIAAIHGGENPQFEFPFLTG